jgi:hypothetical protein
MDKWEYLKIMFYGGSGSEGKITVIPTTNVDLASFMERWPQVTLREEKYETYLAYPGFDPTIPVEFLDFLGQHGWEAYAVEGSSYYFKRKIG